MQPPNMYPTAGGPPFLDGLSYGLSAPPASLVMPQVSQAQPTALPLNQPPIQSSLPVTPAAGFFNTPPFVPQVAQQLPQVTQQLPQVQQHPPLVQHKPITAPTPTAAPAPAPAPAPAVTTAVPATAQAPALAAQAPALAAPAIFNRALNNQPVEKEPPANVVITSSDPLPKPAMASAQPTLSVTIPPQHIKPSLVQAAEPPPMAIASTDFKFSLGNNNKDGSDVNIFKGLGTSSFSFKMQVEQAAAEKQKELAAEAAANNESVHSEGNQSVGHDTVAELDYDPRPDFQGIIPLPDEVEVRTGEEDEEIKFSYRAKLFRLVDKEWKERGIGDIKILKNQTTGCSRILMRREQTHKICANHKITAGMNITTPEQDKEGKSFLWVANDFADEKLQMEKFLVRFKLPDTATQFKLAFEEAVKSVKSDHPSVTFDNVNANNKTSTINSFVTSTPAANVFSKQIEPPKPDSIDSTIESVVSKSLFGNMGTKSSSGITTISSVSNAPFANFSFGSIANANPPNYGNMSFGSVSVPDASNSSNTTGYTTAFNFGSSLTSKADSTLQDQQKPLQAVPTKTDSQVDAEEEYEPTAQFQPVIPLPELIDVVTGEENEIVLFEHRAKLLRYDKAANEWKERGLGIMKLLQQKSNPSQVRLLMRREQIFKLCCNQRLLMDTVCNPKSIVQYMQ